ncbi:MAG: cupredoxin domain-containing protein [Chloroflexi bacterium]|nr:cupredoxin domain-containing protein [Chloroflexota bacterium]
MRKTTIILLLLIFTLPACASGSTTIDLTMDEFSFTPTEFTVPAGQEITITARNEGAVIHEFAIMKFGKTVGEDFGDEDDVNIYWAVKVEPGGSITQTFTAPTQPGEYQIVCGIPGHFMAGMFGKLIVVEDR